MFVVTGGGSGIGRALAQALALRHHPVLIIGRREKCLAETAKVSPLISFLCADVSTQKGRNAIIAHLSSQKSIKGLVHNAALIDPIAPLMRIAEHDWKHVFATNVEAPLFLTQALQAKLKNARVLHMGSGAAYFPVASWAPYCVSKAALAMLTRCWQTESTPFFVASVMPGIIDTDMQAIIRKSSEMDPEKNKFFHTLYEKKQLLSPDTVALFLSWLLLDVNNERYISEEWDIYKKIHHHEWLIPPHVVPTWE